MPIFSHIKNLFPKDQWDVGYLTQTQLKICGSYPIKSKCHLDKELLEDYANEVHFYGLRNCIVLIRYTEDTGDYAFYEEAIDILNKSSLKKWHMIYTNFKEAALQAGLGVTAKNSLVHTHRFGFDSKICAVGFEDEITDPPTNKKVNKKLWDRCVGCWDCAINCPVKAIHNDGDKMENNWLDGSKCDDFIGLSDHPTIPSIKKFWHKNVHPEVPKKEVTKLKTLFDVLKKYGQSSLPFDKNGYSPSKFGVRKDNKDVLITHCRECTSQPRCSQWKGHYPYAKKEASSET